jgi:DNA-directed RNA polymerase specialized sigma24 family protein
MTDTRIAEILDCRPSTVRSSIRRGLHALRAVIDR